MASTPLKYLNQYITTTLSVVGGINDSQTTGIVIQSDTGIETTKPGIALFSYSNPINTSLAEWITYTSISANELQGVTRGAEGFSAKPHTNGVTIAFPISKSHINNLNAMFDTTGLDIKQIATPANPDSGRNKLYFKSDGKIYKLNSSGVESSAEGIISTSQYLPDSFLINGKIVPSVASNNLTVAIKGMDGNDPSASNPVYIRIGDTVRTITAALSVTKNAGTNWCNAGSSELATKEIDYFVYLGYNATDGVTIGFARIPYAGIYSDFSTTSTDGKYCAISTITNAAAGDNYVNIGRFAATLSAGAGYTWTVPTFTSVNLIQRPIFSTRFLSYVPTSYGTTGSAGSYAASNQVGVYRFDYRQMYVKSDWNHSNLGSWTGNLQHQLPFGVSAVEATHLQHLYSATVGTTTTVAIEGGLYSVSTSGVITYVSSFNSTLYAYSSLAAADWLAVNSIFELA